MLKKVIAILKESLPIILMVEVIPFVGNDYIITSLYLALISVLFLLKREKYEFTIFCVGLVVMTIFEFIFIKTGVETFLRNSLFNSMPLWLPLLWGYGFVVIKRSVAILQSR